MREIVCVCYGNLCRSPMAQALFQIALDNRFGAGEFIVSSAGVQARDGEPPDKKAVKVLEGRGVDAKTWRSRRLTTQITEQAWRIYCMEEYQAQFVRSLTPDKDKVRVLSEEIPDPIGQSQKAFESTARQLEAAIQEELDDIARAI